MFSAITLTFGPFQIFCLIVILILVALGRSAWKSWHRTREAESVVGHACAAFMLLVAFFIAGAARKEYSSAQNNLPREWSQIVVRLHERPSGMGQYTGLQSIVRYCNSHPEVNLPQLDTNQFDHVTRYCGSEWKNSCVDVLKPYMKADNPDVVYALMGVTPTMGPQPEYEFALADTNSFMLHIDSNGSYLTMANN